MLGLPGLAARHKGAGEPCGGPAPGWSRRCHPARTSTRCSGSRRLRFLGRSCPVPPHSRSDPSAQRRSIFPYEPPAPARMSELTIVLADMKLLLSRLLRLEGERQVDRRTTLCACHSENKLTMWGSKEPKRARNDFIAAVRQSSKVWTNVRADHQSQGRIDGRKCAENSKAEDVAPDSARTWRRKKNEK